MLTQEVFPFIFLLIPLIAILLAITKRNKYWITAILIALIPFPIQISLFQDQLTCRQEFCGLGDWFIAIILTIIIGTIAVGISAITAPKVINDEKDQKAGRKALLILVALLVTPVLLLIIYSLWVNSLGH